MKLRTQMGEPLLQSYDSFICVSSDAAAGNAASSEVLS